MRLKLADIHFFILEFVLCTNSSLFKFKRANEHREFRNYLKAYKGFGQEIAARQDTAAKQDQGVGFWYVKN